jgi:hypothetical protein
MSMLALTLGALAAAEHHFVEQEAVSLLQLAAQKRGVVDQVTGFGADTDAGVNWGGKPFFICEGVAAGSMSHCPVITDTAVVDWAAKATSVRDCGIVANLTGADTFNFDDKGQKCTPLKCGTVDVKAGPPPHDNDSAFSIYSMFCGLTWVNGHFKSHVCGGGIPLYYGYHKFLKPPAKACEQTLNFSDLVSNKLRENGAMIFSNVLPGVDVSITADGYERPRRDRTGESFGFAFLSIRSNTSAVFTFTFHKHGTHERVKVDHFIVSLAELTTSKGCWNKIYVTASNYAGYYVSREPKMVIKGFGGNAEAPPSVSFRSAHAERGKPKHGHITLKRHKDTSASIYYRGTDSFTLKADTFDEKWAAGATLRIGGQSLTRCSDD